MILGELNSLFDILLALKNEDSYGGQVPSPDSLR